MRPAKTRHSPKASRGFAVRVVWRAAAILLGALVVGAYFASSLSPQTAPGQSVLEEPGYIAPETCARCHRSIWESYRKTGMGRSFYRPSPANTVASDDPRNAFYHKPSDSYFTTLRRDGKYYQRRYQIDPGGRQINVMEKPIDFIMG